MTETNRVVVDSVNKIKVQTEQELSKVRARSATASTMAEDYMTDAKNRDGVLRLKAKTDQELASLGLGARSPPSAVA